MKLTVKLRQGGQGQNAEDTEQIEHGTSEKCILLLLIIYRDTFLHTVCENNDCIYRISQCVNGFRIPLANTGYIMGTGLAV